MFYKPMLLPLLAQVFLTFVVWFYLYALRIPEIRSKGIDLKDLKDRAESHRLLPVSAAASNNLKNLFEMPVLFYAAVLLTLVMLVQDPWLVALATMGRIRSPRDSELWVRKYSVAALSGPVRMDWASSRVMACRVCWKISNTSGTA